MRHDIRIAPSAFDEMAVYTAYLREAASLSVADAWQEGVLDAIESLADFPDRCPLAREADDLRDAPLRQLIHKSHRLIYFVHDGVVHILHIRHAARDERGEL